MGTRGFLQIFSGKDAKHFALQFMALCQPDFTTLSAGSESINWLIIVFVVQLQIFYAFSERRSVVTNVNVWWTVITINKKSNWLMMLFLRSKSAYLKNFYNFLILHV